MEAFGIPAEDRNMRIQEWEPENFLRNPGKSPCYTLIEINAFKGRSREAKKRLYDRITSRLGGNPGIPASDILIFIHEIPLENWGIRGLAADEIDLGFSLQV
jgi:phenylpyruvate tautomerase PptA (4-oxalocrotonate tautomerase family)